MNRRTKNQLKVAAGITVLAASIVTIAVIGMQSLGTPVADRYGCYNDFPQAKTVLLVDASEPRFDAEQARSIRTYLDDLKLRFNEVLNVYTTEGDVLASVVKPRFHVCGLASTPQELADVGLDPVQANFLARQKERQRDELLNPEYDAIFSSNLDSSRAQLFESPLLQMTVAIAREGLGEGDRLIYVSDMIENASDSARFCTVAMDMVPFANFRKRASYDERLKPKSLKGVDVTVLMLLRRGYGHPDVYPYCRDEEEIKNWWRGYFEDNGAASVEFIRIRPLGGA